MSVRARFYRIVCRQIIKQAHFVRIGSGAGGLGSGKVVSWGCTVPPSGWLATPGFALARFGDFRSRGCDRLSATSP